MLKSAFISGFFVYAVAATIFAALGFASTYALSWAAAMIAGLAASQLLVSVLVLRIGARMPEILWPWHLVVTMALIAALVGALIEGRWAPVGIAAGALLGSVLYEFWYSRLQRPYSEAVIPGQDLPVVGLRNHEGDEVSTEQLARQCVLYVLIRGNWCPVDIAQIRELAQDYPRLKRGNVEVVIVSPQSGKRCVALAEMLDVDIEVLSDRQLKLADALGIRSRQHVPLGLQLLGYRTATVLPTLILVDQNRRILWTHQTEHYRMRPEPSIIISAIRERLPNFAPSARHSGRFGM